MRVPLNWLKEYIDIDISPVEVADRLTNAGIEVEGIHPLVAGLDAVIAVEVMSFTKHPAADKLWIVKVFTGEDEHQVVAGIQNYAVGDIVPLAPPGTDLPGGRIEKVEIRGVTSFGMLCAADELGLELVAEEGILILDRKTVPGTRVTQALGLDGSILELGLTPNRNDCLGLLGVAREVSVLTGNPVTPPFVDDIPDEGAQDMSRVEVVIEDTDLCSRYSALLMEDIKIAPSPLSLQIKLLQAGIRPINNVVDISNYVMWETGQPLHTFDFDLIKEQKIVVRRAHKGEVMKTLDEQDRTLTEDMLVIADTESPVALAGVMGGFESEISESTRTVLIEAACFNPVNNRRTARALGLTSEASSRFEKGVDPEGTLFAAGRAAYLIEKIAGGRMAQGYADVYPHPLSPKVVNVYPHRVREVLGLTMPEDKMQEIFESLGFSVKGWGDFFSVSIPSWRRDISLEVDLIEEVARIYGYEHIETTLPTGLITQGEKSPAERKTDKIKSILLGAGISEAITLTFMKGAFLDDLKLPPSDELRRAVPVKNPLSEEQDLLRTNLLGNLLSAVKYNQNRQQDDVYLFEIGKVFRTKELPLVVQPQEILNLGVVITGRRGENSWRESPAAADFYWLKGVLEGVFQGLYQKDFSFEPIQVPFLHPTQAARIMFKGQGIGVIGTVHPAVLESYDIVQNVICLEMDITPLITEIVPHAFTSLPRYPAIKRDMALVVPESVSAAAVEEGIRRKGGNLLEELSLFDVYKGDQLAEGKKSLAYTLVFRGVEGTLRDEKVNELQKEIIECLASELGVTLRS